MTAKEYLRQLWRIDNEISIKQELVENLRAQIGISQMHDNQDRVKGSGCPQDHMSDQVVRVVDLEQMISRKKKRLEDLKVTIIKQIEEIDGESEQERQTFRIILECRYVLHMSDWDDIGRAANYSKSQAIHLHGKALQVFEAQYLKHRTKSD